MVRGTDMSELGPWPGEGRECAAIAPARNLRSIQDKLADQK
jgi:hypothetical protein